MSRFLLSLAIAASAWAQQAPVVLYAATDIGVQRSLDRGRTWQRMNDGLDDLRATVVAAGMRNDPRVLYAGTAAGLYKTTDGQRWTVSLQEKDITAIAVDPADEQRVYAAASGKLWASIDGGREWRALTAPFAVGKVAVDPWSSYRLYIVSSRNGDMTFATSTDRGVSWRSQPLYPSSPFLQVDPLRPGRLYVAPYLLSQSNDYGDTWYSLGPQTTDLQGVLPTDTDFAELFRFTAVTADPMRAGDVHTCLLARWYRLADPEDPLGRYTSDVVPGWASLASGLWIAGGFPNDAPCTAVAADPRSEATIYAAGSRIYRRDNLLSRRLTETADLGAPVRMLLFTGF